MKRALRVSICWKESHDRYWLQRISGAHPSLSGFALGLTFNKMPACEELRFGTNIITLFSDATWIKLIRLGLCCSRASLVAQWLRICLQCRRHGFDLWVGKIPWRRKWQPTAAFLPGESHGQRSLVDYSPLGHRVGHDLATKWQHMLQ